MKVGWRGADGEDRRELLSRGLPGTQPNCCAVPAAPDSRLPIIEARFARHEWLAAAIVVIAAATVVIVPMLVLGAVSGRDFQFHLASWMDVARQWHHGTIYPQWAELANWGLGEPRFVFYPPGSWMLGAALGSLLAWKIVPTLFVWLVLIGAGISMFLLARESLTPRQAVLVAALFAANPYHLFLIYYRSDFAELLASAFFPLLPLGVVWVAREGWRRVPILALVVALIWLSNAPAAVIAVYSLVFLFLVAYAVRRDLRLLVYGAAATAGGFGLAAFYILPAARERAWVQITQLLTDGHRPEQNFLFTRTTSLAVNTDFNLKISCVVVLMGLVAGIAAYVLAKSSAIPRMHFALFVALGAMSFFMMWHLSRPLWMVTPELHFVQFPWRYAVPFGVAFAFLVGAAAAKSNKLAILAVCLFVFAGPLAKILLAVKRPSSWNKAGISRLQQNIDNGIGYRGTLEYLPNGANGNTLSDSVGNEARITGKGSKEISTGSQTHDPNTFVVESLQPQQITIERFDFPTWQVNLDGARLGSKLRDGEGRIVVSVPPGKHVIQIVARRDWDATLGGAISIASATSLLGLTFMARHKDKPALRQTGVGPSPPAAALHGPALPLGNQPPARWKL
jgi:hypothetical protein